MRRTIAISKRIFLELIRDKRTLAMLFLAPVLILTLLNYVFSINTSTSVNIGVVNVQRSMKSTINDVKHVNIKEYDNKKEAKKALDNQKVDAIFEENQHDDYSVLYANTSASKTAMIRRILSASFTQEKTFQMADTLKQMTEKLGMNSDNKNTTNDVNLKESYNYGNKNTTYFSSIMPIFMGFFVFLFVFLISGMSLLKERTSGTLGRLLATPVKRSEIVFGYILSYSLVAIIQTTIIVFFTIYVLNVQVTGSILNVFIINLLLALVALTFGLLLSTLANSEFQMMQFIPIIVVPQIIFSGIIPLDSMATWAQWIGNILPMKYASNAMTDVILYGKSFANILPELLMLIIFIVVLLVANIFGLRRYRKV